MLPVGAGDEGSEDIDNAGPRKRDFEGIEEEQRNGLYNERQGMCLSSCAGSRYSRVGMSGRSSALAIGF